MSKQRSRLGILVYLGLGEFMSEDNSKYESLHRDSESQNGEINIKSFIGKAMKRLKDESPLIHCITSPIAINDCANLVLALGAKPIMAEYCDEAADITGMAKAVAFSFANITEARLASIRVCSESAAYALKPRVVDAVGVTCSRIRKDRCTEYIDRWGYSVIKGNISEIKALSGAKYDAVGIDSGSSDRVLKNNKASIKEAAGLVCDYAKRVNSVVLATGEVDIVSDGRHTYALSNGVKELSLITGTGCMLNCMIATYMSVLDPLEATIAATLHLSIAGEIALEMMGPVEAIGLGSYHVKLMDAISLMTAKMLADRSVIKKIEI